MSHLTAATLAAETKSFADKIDRSRNGAGYAMVRASFVVMLASTDGVEQADGTVEVLSENAALKRFGITRSPGQRAMKAARVALTCGYSLEDLAALKAGTPEYVGAARLFAHANAQGVKAVTPEQWAEVEAERFATMQDAASFLDDSVEAEKDAREAEAAEKAEERKAEKAEAEAEAEHAASPAGKVSALVALAANLSTIAHVGGLTEDEYAIVIATGAMLAGLDYVEAPEADEAEAEADAA